MHMTTQLPILMSTYRRGTISIICWPHDGSLFDRAARSDESNGEMYECIIEGIVCTEVCSRLHTSRYVDMFNNEKSVEVKERHSHS